MAHLERASLHKHVFSASHVCNNFGGGSKQVPLPEVNVRPGKPIQKMADSRAGSRENRGQKLAEKWILAPPRKCGKMAEKWENCHFKLIFGPIFPSFGHFFPIFPGWRFFPFRAGGLCTGQPGSQDSRSFVAAVVHVLFRSALQCHFSKWGMFSRGGITLQELATQIKAQYAQTSSEQCVQIVPPFKFSELQTHPNLHSLV